MTNLAASNKLGDPEILDAPKIRQCLRCRVSFQSVWAGERICSHCKKLQKRGNKVGPCAPTDHAARTN